MSLTLTDRCSERLRKEILNGALRLNKGLLTERYLCKHLRVSRVTVRRCLAQLREENLVRSIPYKGYVLGPAAYLARGESGAEAAEAKGGRNGKHAEKDLLLYVQSPDAVPVPSNPHMKEIWEAAQAEAQERGLRLDLCCMPLKPLISDLKTTFKKKLRGVIVDWYDREVGDTLLAEGVPAVSVEFHHEGMAMDGVMQNDQQGTDLAIERLWALGHRRIGLVVWTQQQYQPPRRRAIFTTELLRRGVLEDERVGLTSRFDAAGGREATKLLFSRDDPPTALFLAHLEMAGGVFDELHARGLKIGKDVSVIAWGTQNTQRAALAGTCWAELPLDLLEWSRADMGRCLVRVLEARRMNPLLPPMRLHIPVRLSLRGSSCPPPKEKG
ncbi:MAG: GntR family transcriptional regulator [Planctomycetes bacterium]|nr:GntR family transcriptional regulator [Planctomycetota bacterium]